MCGEDKRLSLVLDELEGSPPRVWGRRNAWYATERIVRITPTCVGKTSCPVRPRGSSGDHPHVCGEDSVMSVTFIVVGGSPPRVWGRPPRLTPVARQRGITPTCVGKTRAMQLLAGGVADHPHVCGEDVTVD